MAEYVINQGVAGESGPNNSQGIDQLRIGQAGDLIVQNAYGKYSEIVERGRAFYSRTASAAVLPIATTPTNAPTLWNPYGSGVICKVLKINLTMGTI